LQEYEAQVAELQEKVGGLEETLRRKDEEVHDAVEEQGNKLTAATVEKKELTDLRAELENKLADAQNLNESLQSELDRLRAEQAETERDLRKQLEQLRVSGGGNRGNGDEELERENQELRAELLEQQQLTDDVRREAQTFLREMKMLTERNGSSWEREEQLASQVNRLEAEVEDWRNRYARTKTQLRSIRASSIGLTIQPPQYHQDSSHASPDGVVTDVHVTKFQISIDELLRTARSEHADKVVEYMKNVIVCVRSITQDMDKSAAANGALAAEQAKLKSRISATANNLITASKNFASAKGLSPVSLLDAAASHLTTAVVELVRTLKVRPTPAGELEDDDDGTLQPVDTTGFFPGNGERMEPPQPPQPFMGLRQSNVSSMYSPVTSPRASAAAPQTRSRAGSKAAETWRERQGSRGQNGFGLGLAAVNGGGLAAPVGGMGAFGIRPQERESDIEDLKVSS
jgi:hypothetical protein